MDALFVAANLAVLPFWFLMIFLPKRRLTALVFESHWSVAWLPVLYLVLFVPNAANIMPFLLEPPQLDPIARLLGTRPGAFIGWVHFLAFDLFVGRWAYLDSRARGFSAWWVSPILVLILMAGPFGLLCYLAIRSRIPSPPGQR